MLETKSYVFFRRVLNHASKKIKVSRTMSLTNFIQSAKLKSKSSFATYVWMIPSQPWRQKLNFEVLWAGITSQHTKQTQNILETSRERGNPIFFFTARYAYHPCCLQTSVAVTTRFVNISCRLRYNDLNSQGWFPKSVENYGNIY